MASLKAVGGAHDKRKDLFMNKIYLDQASTSFPKAPSVAQAVYDYLAGSAVNVNRGGYRAAYSVEEQIFETREQLLITI